MRKPALIRAVYAELRAVLGDTHSASDVLRMATLMVSAYKDPFDELAEFGISQESQPFYALPVDEAMRDGGWRILMFENKRATSWVDARDPIVVSIMTRVLNRRLGPEWQHFDWIGHALDPH